MNSAPRNIAIEKNRAALLRIVRWWLMVAAMFGPNRVLPRRIGLWVSDIIFKAEQAAYYLQIASGYVQPALPIERCEPLTIKAVIHRLKAVKRTLIKLNPSAARLGKRVHHFHPHSGAAKFYRRGGMHMLAVFSCRAPPCLDVERYASKI